MQKDKCLPVVYRYVFPTEKYYWQIVHKRLVAQLVTLDEFAKFSELGNRLIIWRSLVQAQAGPHKESPKWRFFFVIACAFTSWLSPSFRVRSNFVDNEPSVDGSLRDKSQAQAGPHKKNRHMAVLFCLISLDFHQLVISFVCGSSQLR